MSARPDDFDIQPNTAATDKAAAELQLLAVSQIPMLCKGLPALSQLETCLSSTVSTHALR